MTRQPDDPGPDYDYEGVRYDQHGDPVMPIEVWARHALRRHEAKKMRALRRSAIRTGLGMAATFALLIWWLT